MRWFLLFVIVLVAALWWTGILTFHMPPSVAKNISESVKTSTDKAGSWLHNVATSGSTTTGGPTSADSPSSNLGNDPSATSAAPATPLSGSYQFEGCSFQAPSDWTTDTKLDGRKFIVSDGTRAFSVFYIDKASNMSSDSAEFSNFILSLAVTGDFKVKAENREPFHGRPAYSFAGYNESDPKFIRRITAFHAGTHAYWVELGKRNGDPSDDALLLQILDTVRINKN